MPENNTINQKIKNIDISKIENITLLANNGDKIKIQTPNFYKIIIQLIKNSGKTEFGANELNKTYNFVIENYVSELDKETYEKLKQGVEIFVKNGGKIEINYKKLDQVGRLLYGAGMIILVIVGMFLAFCGGVILEYVFPNEMKKVEEIIKFMFNPVILLINIMLITAIVFLYKNSKTNK